MTGPADLPPGGVPPEEAIAFFRAKGYRIGFSWLDVFRTEHSRWFTVAKAMSRDLLEDIRGEVDRAIADGTTLAEFKKSLRPKLEARGWWGRKRMMDPATGEAKIVQLGSPRRLKTIFNANVRSAYQAGKWERIERTAVAFPFLEYSSVMDGRERPQHHAWHGTILPVDDPWWDTHYGPCDWECRCTAVQRSQRMLDRQDKTVTVRPPQNDTYEWVNERTGETGTLEEGIGKGWDFNVGKEYLRGLAPSPLPESFDGPDEVGPDEIGAAALNDPQQQLVDRFLGKFGIDAGSEAIWYDRDGWPLSIGRGWFVGRDGRVRLPRGAAATLVDQIAAAITTPSSIAWAWVRAIDGRALLMRRYTRMTGKVAVQVDIGAAGWRWQMLPAAEIAASYDRYVRDANGRFASGSTGAGVFADAIRDRRATASVFAFGPASKRAQAGLGRLGLSGEHKGQPKAVIVERSLVTHIFKRHGTDHRGQKPIEPSDIAKGRDILNTGVITHGTPRVTPAGVPRIHVKAEIDGARYSAAFEVRRRRIALITLRKR